MKKLLFIFMIIDFVFVAAILTLSRPQNRTIASDDNQTVDQDLTEGQLNKKNLVKTFRFEKTSSELRFSTDKLQMICDSSTSIQLRYSAQDVAVAGEKPSVTHTFNCEQIKINQSQLTLVTSLADFQMIQTKKQILLQGSELASWQIYSDEKFPNHWRLTEIKITGPHTFTVNEFEIESTLFTKFDFTLTSAR